MKKLLIACAIAVGASVAAAGAEAAGERGGHGDGARGGGGHGWSGRGDGGRQWSGGDRGSWRGDRGSWRGDRGSWNGGRHWNGNWRDTRWHGHRSHVFGSVFLGWPYWWGPSYYYDYPAYSYYGGPAYYDSTQIYVEPSGTAAQPSAPAQAQYYCPDAGYYPAVPTCARGWLRVVPDGTPPR
jgi:hypothetical protein